MAFPKLPSSQDLWKKHEELVLEVFEEALKLLCSRSNLPDGEDAISRILAKETRESNFKLEEKGRGLTSPPNWEQPIPPKSEGDLEPEKKNKRPDFTCQFRDYNAPSSEDAYLDYHVECKRLGTPSSPGWNLNRNYVTHGIMRFIDPEFNYGRGTVSGAMIGYIQSMDFDTILSEVNSNIDKQTRYAIPLLERWNQEDHISRTSQRLVRSNVSPSPFDLRHLWVVLKEEK